MKNLTSDLVPRCVGRYLIDLPREFGVNPVARAQVEDVTVIVEPMERTKFDQRLRERTESLRMEKIFGEETASLADIHPLPDNQGSVFNRSKSRDVASHRTLELHGWKNGYAVQMESNAFDRGLDKQVPEWDTRQTNIAERLAHLLSLYSRTSGRADHEIPTGPGVCVRHGFIQGPATDQEWIELNYYLSTAEDVSFTFRYLSHIGPMSDTLLQRGGAIEPALAKVNGRTLRKGVRDAHPLKPEEWLMEREIDPGVKDYHFTLEINSKQGNAHAPLLVIDLDSGSRIPRTEGTLEEAAKVKPIAKATLGEAESIALWDAVIPTLRARPGAF
ncbi:MAG TPA: T6SS immunity protein Tli4 family protein [Burkholderiaceae bacterium]|nr:T6SS immunity protein Tli4 family protein [Burkholderiaceae bacterium]